MKLSINQDILPAAVCSLVPLLPLLLCFPWMLLTIGQIIAQMHAVHVETQLQLKP